MMPPPTPAPTMPAPQEQAPAPIGFYGNKPNAELQTMFEDGTRIGREAYPDFVPDRTTDRFIQIQGEKKANQVLSRKISTSSKGVETKEETLGDGRIRITRTDNNGTTVSYVQDPTQGAQAPAPVYTPPPSRIKTPQMGGRPSFDFSDSGNFNLR